MITGRSPNTVKHFLDDGTTVTVYCHNPKCHHNAVLDLALVERRFGPDQAMLADDLLPKLKCGRCGGKQLGMIRSPRTMDAAERPIAVPR